jgi:hypothetical protein
MDEDVDSFMDDNWERTQVQRVNSRNRSAEPDEAVIFGDCWIFFLAVPISPLLLSTDNSPIYHKGNK